MKKQAKTLPEAKEKDRMPKVSVIIPIFNVAQYLDQALESAKRQTLHDIEIVCVNDGSTDNSLEIVRKWAEGDDRFVIIDKVNEGYGVAMNTGVERASGEYIGILEPDDYVDLTMYEDLYRIAAENDLDMAKADFYKFVNRDERDVFFKYAPIDKSGKYYNMLLDPSMMPELTALVQRTWPGIYRRDFLIKNNIWHHTTPGAAYQDNGFFWQTSIFARRAMLIDKPYYRYRSDNPNASVKKKDKIYAHDTEYDFIKELIVNSEDRELWDRFKTYYYLSRFRKSLVSIKRSSDEFRREYVEYIYDVFDDAVQRGEVDPELFSEKDRPLFDMLMKSPEEFYNEHAVSARSKDIDKTVNQIIRLKDKLEKKNRKIRALNKENEELQKEKTKLNDSITKIKSGRSYKLARKMDRLIKIFKK